MRRWIAAAVFGVMSVTAQAGEAPRQLVFAAFGGTFQKALEATVIPIFEKEHNLSLIHI